MICVSRFAIPSDIIIFIRRPNSGMAIMALLGEDPHMEEPKPMHMIYNTQWIGLWENLQETIDFTMKYCVFLHFFP